MNGPLAVRLSALAAAVAVLVLGAPPPASAQCAASTYHGGLPLWTGTCPEGVAGGASVAAVALAVLAAGGWLARAWSRGRDRADADLALLDEVFDSTPHMETGAE
ncbi:hypothetical protein ACIPPJ_25615 [Streptomyces sp. NPDC086091]|uniref:hypothetical protein n=1 Tax=Streptomyces sp. NPDC086091 TaxID=3365751 RepID=UPI0037F6CF7F